MTGIFMTPPQTSVASFQSIARNVVGVSLHSQNTETTEELTFQVESDDVFIQHGYYAISFDRRVIDHLEVAHFIHAGNAFLSLVVGFHSDQEPLHYRFITSHQSETAWLMQTAKKIGDILGYKVELPCGEF